LPLVEVMNRGALTRGEGCAIAAVGYSEAVLYNGLGEYRLALEAAARVGEPDVAHDAADRLSERTAALRSAWATGAALRSRALVADGAAAENLYRHPPGASSHGRSRARSIARAPR